MGAASVPGTSVNGRYMRYGVFVLTIDGRRTGAPHGTLLAAPRAAAPRWYMLYLRRYCRLPRRRGLHWYIARVYGAHHPQMGEDRTPLRSRSRRGVLVSLSHAVEKTSK